MTDDSSPPVAAAAPARGSNEAKLEPASPAARPTEAADLEGAAPEVPDGEDAPRAPWNSVVQITTGEGGAAALDESPASSGAHANAMRFAGSPTASSIAESFFIGDDGNVADLDQERDEPLPPLDCPEAALMELLASSGFAVDAAAGSWQQGARQPRLVVRVSGHVEHRGHTRYTVDCELLTPGDDEAVCWTASKRLADIRLHLHLEVKQELGDALYEARFSGTPFAKTGAPWGTTRRLDAWCGSLTACIADTTLPAVFTAKLLLFLEAPFSDGLAVASGSDGSVSDSDFV